ncbi:hypothetical protein [Halobacillus mangrovi]|uniref:Uncharacterized protein n=1 Tax=Halobacillus mangrovi TaxID=402384 RepID=A0A1W5ZSD6_9BACI|nr:hypothetical protein [Halobacillus mangrovi]ARI76216.1 hypothetical protein HM131_04920 [Halobacillus mangrovi]
MKLRTKTFISIASIGAALLIAILVFNYNSFEQTKRSCIENGGNPIVDKDFLSINWSVSCGMKG